MEQRDVEKMRGKIYKKLCVEIEQSEDDKLYQVGVLEKKQNKKVLLINYVDEQV